MGDTAVQTAAGRRGWRGLTVHAGLFAALWWALTGGDASTWLVGVPVVAAATAASHRLWPAGTGWWSPVALLRFVAHFLRESVRGGVDVARRALSPSLPLDPGMIQVHCRLARGPAEVFLVDVLSLLPGTLSVDLDGSALTLHVLDRDAPVEEEVRELERLVAAMFRVPLEAPGRSA
jgi:multicomponent Na+:H+ antiporter subunit E